MIEKSMLKLNRIPENPLIAPQASDEWEAQATFNPAVIYSDGVYHMLYRALSSPKEHYGTTLPLSTIGHAVSTDGIHFIDRKQFIKPDYDWELYGCEDPRITKIDDLYYIFYTALSTYPFSPDGIKVGLAITRDFQTIQEKHLVTPFNAKAMSLFPEMINGKLAAILTTDTDRPPAKIGIAYFDKREEIWDHAYWKNWYDYISDHALQIQREPSDHIEIGAPPLKTEKGWLLIYSYIKNYFSEARNFGIEGILLQENNPLKITARTEESLLSPEELYEKEGLVNNVVFPSSAVIKDDVLSVYYGGADTVCCLATCNRSALLRDMKREIQTLQDTLTTEVGPVMFTRFNENPIIKPTEHSWEKASVVSPTAVSDETSVHLFYGAISDKGTASIGYARSNDGLHIDFRSEEPVYVPRESFETNFEGNPHGSSNPKMTRIDGRYYLCYTTFDGKHTTGIGLTSIAEDDLQRNVWNWETTRRISWPGTPYYEACLFPEKINGAYTFLVSKDEGIYLDYLDDLSFNNGKTLQGDLLIRQREDKWDSGKIGIGCPPVLTKDGWLLLYDGVTKSNMTGIGCLLMDRNNPTNILARMGYPILIPQTAYEHQGNNPNTVLSGGSVLKDNTLTVYYAAGGSVIGIASINMVQLLDELLRHRP